MVERVYQVYDLALDVLITRTCRRRQIGLADLEVADQINQRGFVLAKQCSHLLNVIAVHSACEVVEELIQPWSLSHEALSVEAA